MYVLAQGASGDLCVVVIYRRVYTEQDRVRNMALGRET
jgi:hypothetical protein